MTEKSWAVDPDFSWITQVNGSFYAIHEVFEFQGKPGGGLSRWQIDNVSGNLVKQEELNLESTGPAHVLVDQENGVAVTGNYGGGSISVVSLNNQKLLEVAQVLNYGKGCRDKSHPHQVIKFGDLYYVVDLGCDAIYSLRLNSGKLEQVSTVQVEEGCGPRHTVFTGQSGSNMAAVVCELANNVLTFEVGSNGSLTFKQKAEFATKAGEDPIYGAEILAHNGYIYASSRGMGVIVVYKIGYGNQINKIQEEWLDLNRF